MTVSDEELSKLLPTLDKAQFLTLTRGVLGLRADKQLAAIGTADVLAAGVWEFLLAVGFVTDGQARGLLLRARPALSDLSGILNAGRAALPTFRIVVAEKRWATWPMHDAWYDLVCDEDIPELPVPGVLLVCCDVTALHGRMTAWLERMRNSHGNESEQRSPRG